MIQGQRVWVEEGGLPALAEVVDDIGAVVLVEFEPGEIVAFDRQQVHGIESEAEAEQRMGLLIGRIA